MRRQVLTLSEKTFRDTVGRLQEKAEAAGFAPDAVVSIRRGGEFVGRLMFPGKPHYAVTLQRPGTRRKNRMLKAILRSMPRFVLDSLRIFEAWWLSRKSHKTVSPANFTLPELNQSARILIVDDAVDSGATLASVFNAVRARYPGSDVMTAVITVTTERPLIQPDFSIYNNLTLIRFPWSIDS